MYVYYIIINLVIIEKFNTDKIYNGKIIFVYQRGVHEIIYLMLSKDFMTY